MVKNASKSIKFLFIAFILSACGKNPTLFKLISPSASGIHFKNVITENDTINPFDVTNIYNGAGVGIGDFNKDGLEDVFFVGNQVPSKLYLNKGDFKFNDVSASSGIINQGKWCRGVSVIDINYDGLPDIYLSATIMDYASLRKNLLYVNQGLKDGIPQFREMAHEYGLDDDSYSTMSYFFDYDNDLDLDLYIVVNDVVPDDNPSVYRPIVKDGSALSTGRLYRNDYNAVLKHPVFTNVTKQAGVTIEGYGHSASITDINEDGWKDILVANDFLSNDLVYINNHDGTFTDRAREYFKHTSANGMGQDAIDINNDGRTDIIEMDMDPEDNLRKKVLMSGYNYQNYNNNEIYGYQYQYVRNTLQLNMGSRIVGDTTGAPLFAETGLFAGISSTDWSWSPVVQDFDNDGLRDLIVTNGFAKDLTDHDFIAFREKSFAYATKKETLAKIPQVKISNYAFRNKGDATFQNVSAAWGLLTPAFSNGAAYADLDNDGDLDLVINNINDVPFLYRNNADENDHSRFLNVQLAGTDMNRSGIGAWVYVYSGGKMQVLEQSPYRGYLSTMSTRLHFGIGDSEMVDSVVVIWPGNKKQVVQRIEANQTITLDVKNASLIYSWKDAGSAKRIFSEVTQGRVQYTHSEEDFVDFNVQKLIPHKLSEFPPGIAAGDLNGDGFDDLVVGGSRNKFTTLLLQQAAGNFISRPISSDTSGNGSEILGVTLFDADNDNDLDIYLVSGSNESAPGAREYQDKLYVNDGKGNFTAIKNALPQNYTSKSCARVADFDHDGDLDIFLAGRVHPWNYPDPASCFIYRNDSKQNRIQFTDITNIVAPSLRNAGLVCDAVWCDFDNDGWQDIVYSGEWLPLTMLKNENGKSFSRVANAAVDTMKGWWNSIAPGDFDNDGDVDFIAGNMGGNSFYSCGGLLSVYANDFYHQGTIQCVTTRLLPDKQGGTLKEFTVHNRDDVVEQLPFVKKRFLTYTDFAKATFDKIFTADELKSAKKYTANYFYTSLFVNDGNGKFSIRPLPSIVQYSMVNGMVVDDFNGDGNLDVCFNTNDYSADPSNGRSDALNGLVLLGDGKMNFKNVPASESGIYIPGNGKALVKLRGSKGEYLLAASENRGPLRLFKMNENNRNLQYTTNETAAVVHYKNGKRRRAPLDNGSSFLSQSAPFLSVGSSVSSVDFIDVNGRLRTVRL